MIHTLWFGYGWPSLKGNGPEDVISLVAIGLFSVFIGRRLKRAWDAHKAAIAHNAKLLQHVIRHSDEIPNHDRHGNLLVDVPLEDAERTPTP